MKCPKCDKNIQQPSKHIDSGICKAQQAENETMAYTDYAENPMPNKNSIESEIDELLNPLQPFIELTNDLDEWHELKQETKSKLKNLIQREVKKGRVEELKRNAYYSQPRKTDPLKLCGIDMTAKQVLDRLEELEG